MLVWDFNRKRATSTSQWPEADAGGGTTSILLRGVAKSVEVSASQSLALSTNFHPEALNNLPTLLYQSPVLPRTVFLFLVSMSCRREFASTFGTSASAESSQEALT